MKKIVFSSILLMNLSGCAAMVDSQKLVQDRATFDLDCPQVNVMEISNRVYGAKGCGNKATYIVHCGGGLESSCKALMNSAQGNEIGVKK